MKFFFDLVFSVFLAFIGLFPLWSKDSRSQSDIFIVHLDIPESSSVSYASRFWQFHENLMSSYKLSYEQAENYADWILQSSSMWNIPKQVLASLIMTESSFRPNVVSR